MRIYAQRHGWNWPQRKRTRRVWTPEEDALLGTTTDIEVAKNLGITTRSVSNRRARLGIPPAKRQHIEYRPTGLPRSPRNRSTLRRSRTINSRGYVVTTISSDHPYFEMGLGNDDVCRTVSEHRLVMANHLGRALRPDEFVHHRNGIRSDNRIENLELWTRSHPDGQRVEDKLNWALEFIERYADFLGPAESSPALSTFLSLEGRKMVEAVA